MTGQKYTVSDGKMMLVLEEAEEGGFVVTSPIDPGLITQAETLQEAFLMAYDAAECLAIGRRLLAERMGLAPTGPVEPSSTVDHLAGSVPPKPRRQRRMRKIDVS
jgi:antitoxin HicB